MSVLLTLTLAAAAAFEEPHRSIWALLATAAVAGAYILGALISPRAMGMGDVYVAGITGGLLGWTGWNVVLAGQVVVWLLGPGLMIAAAITHPEDRGTKMESRWGQLMSSARSLPAGSDPGNVDGFAINAGYKYVRPASLSSRGYGRQRAAESMLAGDAVASSDDERNS